MTNARLTAVLEEQVDELQGRDGRWQFTYEGVELLVLTEETRNRMRIIAR